MRRGRPKLLVAALFACLVTIAGVVTATAESGETGDDPQVASQMDGLTDADEPWNRRFDQAMLDGRRAYNDSDWPAAIDHFIQAIQLLPERPAAYRNLARAYNLDGQLVRATGYYDIYLELAPDADDASEIREERRGAVARGGDDSWTPPADQRMARRALDRELDDGRALTAGGGGARGMFETLIDLGYAEPELQALRARLETKLVDEFKDRLRPSDGFLPVLSRDDWTLQQERLSALQTLTRAGDRLQWIERRQLVVDAATAVLDGDYRRGIEKAEQAAEANKDLGFVPWYRAVALDGDDRPEDALSVVDELRDTEAFGESALGRIDVFRARLLQRLGRNDEAADILEQLLVP